MLFKVSTTFSRSKLCVSRLHSTNEIILPVLPPILLTALYAEDPTLEMVELAEL
jgi:hypothetical protein